MKIYSLVDSILEDISRGPYYMEMPVEHLKDSLFEYLNDEYQKKISEVGVYFEIKKMSGEDVKEEDYEREFSKVKFEIIKKMEEISRSS